MTGVSYLEVSMTRSFKEESEKSWRTPLEVDDFDDSYP